MEERKIPGQWRKVVWYVVPSTALLAASPYLIGFSRFGTAVLLVAVAVAVYFYIVAAVAEKNWMDIRGVFHGVWIGTIGLASLKLLDYQEVWQVRTWFCMAGAYAAFQIGANLGIEKGRGLARRAGDYVSRKRFGRVSFKLHPERLFWVCVVTTLIGLVCFSINVAIRGYIPGFSDEPNAYVKFYTRFHVFAVAATCISGLCYYCLKTQALSRKRKVVLWLCILYATFLFPVLVVSRGTFVVSALSLTVTVFYLNRRKLWVLFACLALIVSVYMLVSALRGYTDAQLRVFFEPSTITLPIDKPDDVEDPDGTEDPGDVEDPDGTEDPGEVEDPDGAEDPGAVEDPSPVTFTLPPKLAFLYGYLTVSHDNFNETVQNIKGFTYGTNLLAPFNVILRNQWLNEALNSREVYLVRAHLTSTNIVGEFYYAFHEWGVVIGMLLWAFVFGLMQCCVDVYKGPFSLLVLGNAMTPVALCFFASWLSNFTQWMLWGTAMLLAIASCLQIERKKGSGA